MNTGFPDKIPFPKSSHAHVYNIHCACSEYWGLYELQLPDSMSVTKYVSQEIQKTWVLVLSQYIGFCHHCSYKTCNIIPVEGQWRFEIKLVLNPSHIRQKIFSHISVYSISSCSKESQNLCIIMKLTNVFKAALPA